MKRTFYPCLMAAFFGCFALGLMAPPAEALDLRDWGKQFSNASGRFDVLSQFNNEAVLDKETQLVWELVAGDTNGDEVVDNDDDLNWDDAREHCANKDVGGRKGWKLSSFDQLASLVDTNSDLCNGGGPCLPDGHPFIGVQSSTYWSATASGEQPLLA